MRAALCAFALLRFGLRLEAGPDYDSNANHVETPRPGSTDPAPIASFLVRTTARGRLSWTGGPSALRLTLDVGGKYFFEDAAQPQDVVVARFAAEARRNVGRASLALWVDYHDAWQWNVCPPQLTKDGRGWLPDTSCHRDFRLGALRTSATVHDGPASLTVEAAARGYEWKPDEDQSFLGAGAAIIPAARLHSGPGGEHEWTMSALGRIEWRRYQGAALASATDGGGDPSAPRRADLVASLGLQASYFGRLFASAGWSVEADRSTSFGGSYLYQALIMELAVPLPSRFTAGARAQLLFFTRGFLPASLAIEDENRNAVLMELSRDFNFGFALRARYSLFRSAPGELAQGYMRHVGSLALSWQMK